MGASSRYRLLQYAALFEQEGNQVEIWPLADDKYLRQLYVTGRRPVGVLFAGYKRRLQQMSAVRNFDAVICEQEAFPYLPDGFERLLRNRARRLFVDYDDAAYIRYEKIPVLKNKIARLMASADAVVVGNRYLAMYAEKFNQRVTVIPSVVDLSRYPVKVKTADSGAVRVAWIGTPITAALLAPLFPVFERLQQKHPEVMFRFIGARKHATGREILHSADSAQNDGLFFRVEGPEWSEKTETNLLVECDIGIMPLPDTEFTRGKCGLKLIQYMACGLPVVASPVGANREIVQHGQNGFLASNAADWEDALACLIVNRDLRERMGGAARERVEREFTLEKGFRRWMGVIDRVAAGREGEGNDGDAGIKPALHAESRDPQINGVFSTTHRANELSCVDSQDS